MQLKLIKISTKPFILIFSLINLITGFIFGAIVTIMSLLAGPDVNIPGGGPWAILIFPIVNGLLGIAAGALVTGLFNVLAKRFGGLGLEFEQEAQ